MTVIMLLAIVLIASAVYGLDFTRDSPVHDRSTPTLEFLPGEVQHDGREDHDGVDSAQYAR